jgi:hypothetical protein
VRKEMPERKGMLRLVATLLSRQGLPEDVFEDMLPVQHAG